MDKSRFQLMTGVVVAKLFSPPLEDALLIIKLTATLHFICIEISELSPEFLVGPSSSPLKGGEIQGKFILQPLAFSH